LEFVSSFVILSFPSVEGAFPFAGAMKLEQLQGVQPGK
jgi:hypothetical protein